MRPSNQFLIHRTVYPSNPSLSNSEKDVVGDHIKGFTEVQIDNILCQSCSSGQYAFFGLPFLADIPFSSSRTLAFLTPSLHNWAVSLYFSQDTCPCFHCLCISFLPFSLTRRSRLIHAGLFPSFPDFLHLGIKSSCALWKASLKICQLCSAPLSLRAVSQGVLLTNSLMSWKFAFLRFRDCELHQCMITAAQAASNLDVTDELTCVGDQQVQYCIPSEKVSKEHNHNKDNAIRTTASRNWQGFLTVQWLSEMVEPAICDMKTQSGEANDLE
ncbi:hypothetical protein QYF61_024136, partial [Mycteria americana]